MKVNGATAFAAVEPRVSLADFLRANCGLTGTHLGCEHGVCGACTVLVDGLPIRSCITYAVQFPEADVRTIEGFDDDPLMQRLREAFSTHHALQCGFCTPGMLITARDIILRLGRPDEQRIRAELSGNLCRCTGYVGIVAAIASVAAEVGEDRRPAPQAERQADAGLGSSLPPEWLQAGGAGRMPRAAEPEREAEPAGKGAIAIAESFELPFPPDRVWEFLGDVRLVASCIPGATVTRIDGEALEGKITVALGPIRASFAGEGLYRRDEAARSGTLTGSGRDQSSGSRARGDLTFQVVPNGAGTRVAADMSVVLHGMLAQFSRPGLVRALAARIVGEFARNLASRLESGAPSSGPAEAPDQVHLSPVRFLWDWFRDAMGQLLGRSKP